MFGLLSRIRKNHVYAHSGPVRDLGKKIFWAILRLLTFRKGIRVNIGGADNIRLHCRFAFSRYEQWGKNHNDGFGALLALCRNKQIVIDVGAHIGLCALPASKVIRPGGRLIAFEPGTANYTYLCHHIQYNRNTPIEALPYLVGETSKEDVPFYESSVPTGMNAVAKFKELEGATWVSKKQVSLDDYCQTNQIVPDVIKIDVEGAEVGVLRGARNTIAKCRPDIVLSVHPSRLPALGESEDSLREIIYELGYDIRDTHGNAVNQFALREYVLTPEKCSQEAT